GSARTRRWRSSSPRWPGGSTAPSWRRSWTSSGPPSSTPTSVRGCQAGGATTWEPVTCSATSSGGVTAVGGANPAGGRADRTSGGSERRPGDGRHVALGLGEAASSQQPFAPGGHGRDLLVGEKLGQSVTEVVGQRRDHPLHARHLLGTQLLTHPAPQDGAELVLGVEGQAVVDAVPVPAGHLEDVPAL